MVNRKWAYRALFDSEDEAAHAYDAAVRRLKPREASSFVNFGSEEAARKRPSHSVLPPIRSKYALPFHKMHDPLPNMIDLLNLVLYANYCMPAMLYTSVSM